MTITAPEADTDTTTGDREPCEGLLSTVVSDQIPCNQPAEYEHIWDKKCCQKTSRTVHCRACSVDEVEHYEACGATCLQCRGTAVLVMVVPL